jgi:hypothetical protein
LSTPVLRPWIIDTPQPSLLPWISSHHLLSKHLILRHTTIGKLQPSTPHQISESHMRYRHLSSKPLTIACVPQTAAKASHHGFRQKVQLYRNSVIVLIDTLCCSQRSHYKAQHHKHCVIAFVYPRGKSFDHKKHESDFWDTRSR